MKKRLVILMLVLGLAPVLSGVVWAGEGSVQPFCLDRIGVRQLQREHGELTGWASRIVLVEAAQAISPEGSPAFVPDFEHRVLAGSRLGQLHYAPNTEISYSQHASAIAAILFGSDPNAWCEPLGGFSYEGIVPDAAYDVYEANWFIFHGILAQQGRDVNADVVSISWGSEKDDFLSQWWQRGIDALSERNRSVVVAGCGNGNDEFGGITKPSSGYNVISVGSASGLGAIPQRLEYFGPPTQTVSCSGPTADGRAKPDCVAPGLMVSPSLADAFSYDIDNDGLGYSSFAVPQVTGIAALLTDAARQYGYEDGDDPRVIKAVILNGADKLAGWHKGEPGIEDDATAVLDRIQGAGMVNAQNAFEHFEGGRYEPNRPAATGWDLNYVLLDPNAVESVRVYDLGVAIKAGQAVKATLCWYRHYGEDRLFTARPLTHLILELWAMDDAGELTELLDVSESTRDNVQHIYYVAEREVRCVVVVMAAAQQESTAADEEYAVAFAAGQGNWQGDQFPADFNADGLVDVRDLEHFLKTWNRWQTHRGEGHVSEAHRGGSQTHPTDGWLPEDLNGDGTLDRFDFQVFSSQWQQRSAWYSR